MNKKETDHNYYIAHRKQILERAKLYDKQNRERFRDKNNLRRRKWSRTWKGIYNVLKQNARKRDILFDITQDQFFSLYLGHPRICFYCHVREENLPESFVNVCGRKIQRLSVDRKDPSVGYILENLVFCCYRCNAIKSDFFTVQEMFNIGQNFVKPKWEAECALVSSLQQ